MVREQGEQGGQTIRKRVRKVVKESIQEVNKDDNNCPVLMENLTFHIFSRYMSDRKRRRGKGASNILSTSMYELMRSGLNHLYRSSGTKMDEEFSSNLKIFMAGMKRTVTNKKIERGESVVEGKKKMSFEVYELMCECFLKGEDSEYIFAHAFLTLEWNLMARSVKCGRSLNFKCIFVGENGPAELSLGLAGGHGERQMTYADVVRSTNASAGM